MLRLRFSVFAFFAASLIGIPLFLFRIHTAASQIIEVRAAFITNSKPIPTPPAQPAPISSFSFSYVIAEKILTPSPPVPQARALRAGISEIQSFLLQQVNDFRKANGLSDVKSNDETCAFAKTRAVEITKNFNHDGFNNRVANKQLPYPSYTKATENIAENSDYKAVVNDWANSPGHAANMKSDTPFVCIAANGNYYVYEGLKP